ncbi:MAG: hypothetical protein PHC61_15430 [Chitinivibrionales bacterium]|nr:hypothetical protein [Chitinivibrionales bacterium]
MFNTNAKVAIAAAAMLSLAGAGGIKAQDNAGGADLPGIVMPAALNSGLKVCEPAPTQPVMPTKSLIKTEVAPLSTTLPIVTGNGSSSSAPNGIAPMPQPLPNMPAPTAPIARPPIVPPTDPTAPIARPPIVPPTDPIAPIPQPPIVIVPPQLPTDPVAPVPQPQPIIPAGAPVK